MHYGRWIVLWQDCSHQHTFYKVLVGHKDVEAMAAVLDTGLQHLQRKYNISCSFLCPPCVSLAGFRYMCLFSVLKLVFSTQPYSRVSQSRERALTAHRQSQHNFMEVLIPYNSLLNGSEGIFGSEGEMR